MQNEIEAFNKQMNLITSQNYELSNELQSFLQKDEIVKSKQLNRCIIVEEIKKNLMKPFESHKLSLKKEISNL